MFDFLKPSKWSAESVSVRANRTLARDASRQQAEICIKAGNFEAAEEHLQRAIEAVEQSGAPRTRDTRRDVRRSHHVTGHFNCTIWSTLRCLLKRITATGISS